MPQASESRPQAPTHLAAPTQAWFAAVVDEFELDQHDLRLLQAACEAWDRAQQARELLATDGILTPDRYGALKPHPAIAIERDARIAFARLVAQLDLAGEPAGGH